MWSSVAEPVSHLVPFDRLLIATLDGALLRPLAARRRPRRRRARLAAERLLARALAEDSLERPRPGLRNALERAMSLCEGGLISSDHLPLALGRPPAAPRSPDAVPETLPQEGVDLEPSSATS